jgi:hypothetical protein
MPGLSHFGWWNIRYEYLSGFEIAHHGKPMESMFHASDAAGIDLAKLKIIEKFLRKVNVNDLIFAMMEMDYFPHECPIVTFLPFRPAN